jgi:protein-arginine kinase activator protein McsA
MKCDICAAEEASVHITQKSEEGSLTIHLCEACAEKKGVNNPNGMLLDLISEFKASQRKGKKPQN